MLQKVLGPLGTFKEEVREITTWIETLEFVRRYGPVTTSEMRKQLPNAKNDIDYVLRKLQLWGYVKRIEKEVRLKSGKIKKRIFWVVTPALYRWLEVFNAQSLTELPIWKRKEKFLLSRDGMRRKMWK